MLETNTIKNKIYELNHRKNKIWRNLEYKNKQHKLSEITSEINTYKTWINDPQLTKLHKEQSNLKQYIHNIQFIDNLLDESKILLELFIECNDIQIKSELLSNIEQLEKKINHIELLHIFSNEHDNLNCYLDLQSGSGGIEAQDWTNMLLRMYLKWIDKQGFKSEIINISTGEINGIKSATLKIIGYYAFGWLRTETGIHRLVRKSPFNTGNRRHTSFSSVFVYADVPNNINININLNDIRIDVYKASGAGGQHVNKTESAIRITHLPTGLTTQCQQNRSQHKNKEQAMKQIQAKLYNLKNKEKNIEKKILEDNKSNIGWGKQIRSYILDQSRIKDLRTGQEYRDVNNILNGDLTELILANLTLKV
ncbi:MAG: peptide chain release factor 2 [Buchnera aphidicola (Eriosoma harunire)]